MRTVLLLSIITLLALTGCSSRRGSRAHTQCECSNTLAKKEAPAQEAPATEKETPPAVNETRSLDGTIDTVRADGCWTIFTLDYPLRKGPADGYEYFAPHFYAHTRGLRKDLDGLAYGDRVHVGYHINTDGKHIVTSLVIRHRGHYHGRRFAP